MQRIPWLGHAVCSPLSGVWTHLGKTSIVWLSPDMGLRQHLCSQSLKLSDILGCFVRLWVVEGIICLCSNSEP